MLSVGPHSPIVFGRASRGYTLRQSIQKLGLAGKLQLCLDAGDIASWPGSGLKWLDTGPNGDDFFLGTDGTTNAPTFVGTPGRLSSDEYWLLGGTQFFRLDAANPAYIDSLHKAGCSKTIVAIYMPRGATANRIFGTDANSTSNVGFNINTISTTGNITPVVRNGSGTAYNAGLNIGITDGVWQMIGLSIAEGGGSVSFRFRNSLLTSLESIAYTSPSAAAATYAAEICAVGNGVVPMPNTSRIAGFLIFDFLTRPEVSALFQTIRGRWSL